MWNSSSGTIKGSGRLSRQENTEGSRSKIAAKERGPEAIGPGPVPPYPAGLALDVVIEVEQKAALTARNLLILRIEYFFEFAKIAQYATKTLQKIILSRPRGQPSMNPLGHVQGDSHCLVAALPKRLRSVDL
jgi:hypothetical protein